MFSYIGGKSRIGKWIKEYIPEDIQTYSEPFSGAFWVFFNMDLSKYKNLTNVIYNDYNGLNSNLFACVKDYKNFYNYIKDIPAQEKERFIKYQKDAFSVDITLNENKPDFQKGLEYIYVVTQVFSGSKPETSNFIDLKGKYKSKFDTFKGKLINSNYQDHFNKITHIENIDFEGNIIKWDNEDAFFYLDPPYWKTEHYYSKHDFDFNDHERLASLLNGIKGKFALSYYDFPELHDWYPKDKFRWGEKEFSKQSAAKKGVKQTKGTELLIMNY